jgi:hypothetical protein
MDESPYWTLLEAKDAMGEQGRSGAVASAADLKGSIPFPALVDALIGDLHSGAVSIAIGVRIVEVLRDGGRHDAASEIEQRWANATSGGDQPREVAPGA